MKNLLILSKLFIIIFAISFNAKAQEQEIQQIDSESVDIYDYQDVPISIDAGNPLSTRYNLAGYLCTLISEYSGSDCSVSPSENSFTSISNIQRLKSDISIIQSDWYMHAINGTSRFIEIGKNTDLEVLSIFQGDRAYLFYKSSSFDNKGYEEILNKKSVNLYIPENKNYDYIFTKAILSSDSKFKKVTNNTTYNFNNEKLVKNLCIQQDDTAIIKLLPNNSFIAQKLVDCGYNVVSIDAGVLKKMVKNITGSYIVKNKFNGKNYNTIGFKTIVAVNTNNSRDAIKSVRFIIENNIKNINKNFPEYHIYSKDDLTFDNNIKYFKKIK